jgi:alkyl hydroperoxide reductase subunit AhpF
MIEKLDENTLTEVEHASNGYEFKSFALLTVDNLNDVINKLNEVIEELNNLKTKQNG